MATFSYTLTVPSAATTTTTADSAPLAKEDDHAGLALTRPLTEYQGLPRFEAYLTAIVNLIQPLEDLGWQLLQERYLDDLSTTPAGTGAIGEQLDGLGEIVGEPRNDKEDEEYRTFLRVRILVNNSDGKMEQLIDILELIEFETIKIKEKFPAHLNVYVTEAVYPLETARFMGEAKAAGVSLHFIFTGQAAADTFSLSSSYNSKETSATTGLGYTKDGVTGGKTMGAFRG